MEGQQQVSRRALPQLHTTSDGTSDPLRLSAIHYHGETADAPAIGHRAAPELIDCVVGKVMQIIQVVWQQ